MNLDELYAKVERLEEYARCEGSELGEVCTLLCRLAGYTPYMSDELQAALVKEIDGQLEWFDDNMVFVESEQVVTHKYRDLVMKDEL